MFMCCSVNSLYANWLISSLDERRNEKPSAAAQTNELIKPSAGSDHLLMIYTNSTVTIVKKNIILVLITNLKKKQYLCK